VALAKVALRGRTRLALLRPRDKFFSLDMMRFADELVPATEMATLPAKVPSDKELKLAQSLVDQLTGPFDPQKHPDEYRARVEALVEEKVEQRQTLSGEPVAERRRAEAVGGDVIDLSALLARSLKEKAGPGPAKVRKTPAKPKPAEVAAEVRHAGRQKRRAS
jgi:DNA end-binding protein Ku